MGFSRGVSSGRGESGGGGMNPRKGGSSFGWMMGITGSSSQISMSAGSVLLTEIKKLS